MVDALDSKSGKDFLVLVQVQSAVPVKFFTKTIPPRNFSSSLVFWSLFTVRFLGCVTFLNSFRIFTS